MKGIAAFVAMLVFFGWAIVSCDNAREVERQRVKRAIIDRKCHVSGYYGRSGEYKTYDCNGWAVREHDL